LIDCHVHLVALADGANGCYMSPRMLRSPFLRYLLWKHGFLHLEDPLQANQKYVEDLLAELRGSQYIGKAILLGMDGVYDAHGSLDLEKTDFLVSNEYLFEVVNSYPNEFWPGVSINPNRRDAIDELDRCVEAGAKLVKVLPQGQRFDPSNRQFIPFYRMLARHKIPLLTHVGFEFSLGVTSQSLGDPKRLRVPLEEGVAVIAAHGCSYGLVVYERFYRTFLELVQRYENFFVDLSALTWPNRAKMLFRLRRHPSVHDRLLFATDYPLPVFHWPCWGRVGARNLRTIIRTSNHFDRHYLILKHLGVGFRSFEHVIW